MKLEIDEDEIAAVLLEYAATKFPGAFDRVRIVCTGYASVKSATFSKADPPEVPPAPVPTSAPIFAAPEIPPVPQPVLLPLMQSSNAPSARACMSTASRIRSWRPTTR